MVHRKKSANKHQSSRPNCNHLILNNMANHWKSSSFTELFPHMAHISKDGGDLEAMSQCLSFQHLRVTRMFFMERSACCPRSQKSQAVQECCSYQLTPPGWPGRSIPGRGYSRNIELWGKFEAHSCIFNIWKTLFCIYIQITHGFFSPKCTLISSKICLVLKPI